MPTMTTDQPMRGPGRPPKSESEKRQVYTVSLDRHLHEWCMSQPEKFSRLIRQLIEAERERREEEAKSQRDPRAATA